MKNKLDQKFDNIFADPWHGKYLLLDEVLVILNTGVFYIMADMLPQPNWPEGNQEKDNNFVKYLANRSDS